MLLTAQTLIQCTAHHKPLLKTILILMYPLNNLLYKGLGPLGVLTAAETLLNDQRNNAGILYEYYRGLKVMFIYH